MHRRNWLVIACSSIGSFALAWQDGARAQEEKPITLFDRLNAGLKCRRPEETAFVETVVQQVEQRRLTPDLVLSTYRWAVEQRPEFPFYYFQYAIRRRAAAVGVTL